MTTKEELRKMFLERRLALTPAERETGSAAIAGAFLRLGSYPGAGVIALYHPINGEVLTASVCARAWGDGKTVLFPRVAGRTLEFLPVRDTGDLRPGAYGVPEPDGGDPVPVSAIHIIVVPALAFDLQGHRLGYGGGYYDSILRQDPRPFAVGIAFDCQVEEEGLPVKSHDAAVDMVLTEKRIIEGRNTWMDHSLS